MTMSSTDEVPVEQLVMVACTECGAGLAARPNMNDSQCAFCGTKVAILADVSQLLAMPAAASAAHQEGLTALRSAFAAQYGVHAATILWAALSASLAWLTMLAVVDVLTGDSRASVLPTGWTLIISVAGGASVLVFRHFRARRLVAAQVARAGDGHRHRTQRGRCPECAVNLQWPARGAFLVCNACHSPLIATRGMLVGWVEDAVERGARWRAQADSIVAAAAAQQSVSRVRAVGAFLIVPLAAVGITVAALQVLAWVGVSDPTGDRVRFNGKPGKVIAQYGRLVRIEIDDDTLWIEGDDVRLQPNKRAARAPADDNRWARGDEVVCDAAPRGVVRVREIYGHMVRVASADDNTNEAWLRDRACSVP